MKKIIPVAEPDLTGNEAKYLLDCVKSDWISSIGSYIKKFELVFSKFLNVRHSIAVSNGTTALHLALHALGIKKGDEVIVPDLTFVATANAVSYTGAKPVFIDSHLDYWNINPKLIENKINKKTKAIIVVHLYGHPVDFEPIKKIAQKYNLFIVEDVAEALGAFYKNKLTGTLGDISCFSFYANKIITTGEGGMITTNNHGLADRVRFLKDHAMSKERRYFHPEIGYNYRMTNMQAAVGTAQMERIDKFISKKRNNAKLYNLLLKDLSEYLILPPEMPWAKSVYWMYSIIVKSKNNKSLRNKLIKFLMDYKIDSRPFFVPMHKLPMYKQEGDFPVSNFLSENGLNLPSSTLLENEDIEYICDIIHKFIKKL